MKTIYFILYKEFLHIKRDKTILPIIFVVPFVQLLILVHAATFEIKHQNLIIVDNDNSSTTRKLIQKFNSSTFFDVVAYEKDLKNAENYLKKTEAIGIIVFPRDFELKLYKNQQSQIQILLDAVNQVNASLTYIYCTSIINNYNKDIILKFADVSQLYSISQLKQIEIQQQFWYNPRLNYKIFMVPGILVLLVTLVGLILTSFNIVREKEAGTIEQINVTPIRKHQFIIGKIVPFYIIGIVELAFGLLLGKILFQIQYLGNIFDVFVSASVYLFAILSFGLLISTFSNNQKQVMLIAWFFMIVFIMMSGLFTSVESMPQWAIFINYLNPVAYFIKILRMILLKGSGIIDVIKELSMLFVLGISILIISIVRYRKTVK